MPPPGDDFVPPSARPGPFRLHEGAMRRDDESGWDEDRPRRRYAENARSRADPPDPQWVDHAWKEYLSTRTRRGQTH